MLIKFQDNENGIEKIKYPNDGNELICNGKNIVSIEYPIEKDKNYEELLPSNLQNMKALYSGHMPDVPNENFRIGYVNVNGEDNFYVVSSSKEKSIRLTEEMGFKPRTIGKSNIVAIDPEKKNTDKLGPVSEDFSTALKKEPPKVYTLKPNPRNVSVPNAAYSNIKNIILIIGLIIMVIIAVSVMTLRG